MLKKRMIQAASTMLVVCLALPITSMAASTRTGAGWQQGPQYQQTQQNQGQNQQVPDNQAGQSRAGQTANNSCGTAAQYMVNQGVMKGSGNGSYNLSGNITRGDLMVMLVRAFDLNSDSGEASFGDVDSDDYYFDAVRTAQNLGIAKGNGANFMPQNNVTVEQAITFIERAMENAGNKLSVDLGSLYDEDALSQYATREDICELLYYALTGNTDGFDGEFGSSNGWNHDASGSLSVAYSTEADETVALDDADFTKALEEVSDDENLSEVKFTALPASSAGILYDDYDEDDESQTKVTKNTSYDADELSDITFVPASGYTGSVTISFVAYTEEDGRYDGKLVITVDDADTAVADTISYSTDEDEAVTLDAEDFTEACEDATGETFSYVKFTDLPSSSKGTLYYRYDEDDETHTKVTTAKSYNEDQLSNITFVPRSGYTGTITISYLGYTADETAYTGIVQITVE